MRPATSVAISSCSITRTGMRSRRAYTDWDMVGPVGSYPTLFSGSSTNFMYWSVRR